MPAGWTILLSFEPATQTRKVKYVTARELLRSHTFRQNACRASISLPRRFSVSPTIVCRIPRSHLFSAYDADIFPCNLLCSGIWISFIHVPCRSPIFPEIGDAFKKGPDGHVHISDNVNRKSIESQKYGEEREVDNKLQKV